jgi:hypothetical protein
MFLRRYYMIGSEKGPVNVADTDPDPYVSGLLDPDPLVRGTDPDPSIIKKKSKKNLDSHCFLLLYYF